MPTPTASHLKTAAWPSSSGAIHSGNQVDARVLQLANQLSHYQRQQLADGRQQQLDAEVGWYNVGAQFDEEVPAQWSSGP